MPSKTIFWPWKTLGDEGLWAQNKLLSIVNNFHNSAENNEKSVETSKYILIA